MNPLRDARAKSEEGLSLIELMVAVFILSVAILALAGVATQSIARVRVARDQQTAADLVSAQMEAARGIDYAVLALDSADVTIPVSYDGHPVVKEAGGPLLHRETVTQGNRTYDITRYVTAPAVVAGDQDPIKKVTIEVDWTDGDQARELVNSTIVTAVDRGLPVPQFDIEPPNAVVAFGDGEGYDDGYDDAATADPQAECTTHTLVNLGLADRYAVRIENRQNSSAMSGAVDLFTDAANKWVARAWLQPASGTIDYSMTGPHFMRDTDPDASGVWFEGSTVVGPQEKAYLTVCYWSTDSGEGAEIDNEQQYLVRVRSQFDESVVETSVHTVTVGEDILTLHLHELDKNHTGNWSGAAHVRKVQNNNYPPMFMDINPATDGLVHDMDTTVDGTSTPGLRIRRDVPASAAVWDHTMQAARPLSSGEFLVRVAAPGTSGTAALTYALQRVTADGATVLETFVSGKLPLSVAGGTGAGATFQNVPHAWTFAPGESIGGGEVLRLVVGCAPETATDPPVATTTDCHVDFDNTLNPGFLKVSR